MNATADIDTCSDVEFMQHIDNLEDKIKQKGFEQLSRGIHAPEAIRFYREILGASPAVIKILEEGYSPNYTARPPPDILENNKSAVTNMGVVIQQVLEWECKGFVKRCATVPRIVNPLTVASKICAETNEIIYRSCLDVSRTVNLFIQPDNLKLDDIRVLLPR